MRSLVMGFLLVECEDGGLIFEDIQFHLLNDCLVFHVAAGEVDLQILHAPFFILNKL